MARSDTEPPTRTHPVILIIDDDEYVHGTLEAALRTFAPRILRAATAAEGIELARTESPDLAVVDLGLPDEDGYALTRRLRQEPDLTAMRIVILTGYVPDELAAATAGADAILAKPFRLSDFLAVIERQLVPS